jgi:hypothetical protein
MQTHKLEIKARIKIRQDCPETYVRKVIETLSKIRKGYVGYMDVEWKERKIRKKEVTQ